MCGVPVPFIRHVVVDTEIIWLNSEKFFGHVTENSLVRYHLIKNRQDQLVIL